MPPTFAAAMNTTCGALHANQSNTAAWSRRSSSRRATVTNSTSSCARRRTKAPPTMPRWPATKTVLPFSSNGVLPIGNLSAGDLEIAGHHFPHELRKTRLRLPAENLTRLAGVADQDIDFRRSEVCRVDADHRLSCLLVDSGLFDALAAPLNAAPDLGECQFDKLAHRARLAGREHEIVWLVRLQDRVHALDIVARMAPVALG